MKLFIIHIALILLLPFAVLTRTSAQTQQDKPPAEKPVAEKPAPEKPVKKDDNAKDRIKEKTDGQGQPARDKFIDNDGNGIDDNLDAPPNENDRQRRQREMKEENRQRMRDKFIDKDGDGINDNRCGGMGIGHKKRMPGRGGK